MAEAIASNNALRSLSLSDNYIGEKGALALAEALGRNTSIVELTLKGNELGDAGAKALCEALQVCVHQNGGRGARDRVGEKGSHWIHTPCMCALV